jgi:hypothetical protein
MRRTVSAIAAATLATALLAGCAPLYDWDALEHPVTELDPILTSDVDPTTAPGFAATPQVDADVLPASELMPSIDGASTRFQGHWDGRDVYLALTRNGSVAMVTVPGGTGSSSGNSVLALSELSDVEGDDVGLVYLPQGTSDLPDGWRAMTDWVAVRT